MNDTYMNAWRSMPTHRPAHLAPYLGKLTRWLSLSRLRDNSTLRRGGGELPLVLDELAQTLDPGADTQAQLELKELSTELRKLIAALGTDERDVFLARYWYAAPIADIASRFGYTPSKVKTMLYRTRKKLLTQLKEAGLC